MEKIIILLVLFQCIKSTSQSQTRKVLFLGNSYTYVNDLPQIISDLAANTGDVLIYDSNLIGGYTLQDHYASTTSLNKILSNNWDYIVLQEQSQRPAFPAPFPFMDGFSSLKTYIRQNKPCAQITSFMTWGHENGDIQNCSNNPVVCSYTGMQNALTDNYMAVSYTNESEVTPVGVVWKYIRENHPSINLYQSDGSHPSLAGSYLAACCFYTSLYRKNPNLITNNYGLDTNTTSIIRNAVKTIVFDQMLDWYIGNYVPNANFTYAIDNGTNQIIINTNTSMYQDSYLWNFGDGATSTAILPTHSYASNGTYTITLTTTKCYLGQNFQSNFQRTVNFCSHSNTILPDDLVLCNNQIGTLSTQPADAYQWLDPYGNPIPGETNQSIQISGTFANPSYSVLTTINGCTEMSPQVLVTIIHDVGIGIDPCESLGIDDHNKNDKILLFPNPVENILTIETVESIDGITVFDILGNKIMPTRVSNSSIDVSGLAKGIYFLEISSNDRSIIKKIIKK